MNGIYGTNFKSAIRFDAIRGRYYLPPAESSLFWSDILCRAWRQARPWLENLWVTRLALAIDLEPGKVGSA